MICLFTFETELCWHLEVQSWGLSRSQCWIIEMQDLTSLFPLQRWPGKCSEAVAVSLSYCLSYSWYSPALGFIFIFHPLLFLSTSGPQCVSFSLDLNVLVLVFPPLHSCFGMSWDSAHLYQSGSQSLNLQVFLHYPLTPYSALYFFTVLITTWVFFFTSLPSFLSYLPVYILTLECGCPGT